VKNREKRVKTRSKVVFSHLSLVIIPYLNPLFSLFLPIKSLNTPPKIGYRSTKNTPLFSIFSIFSGFPPSIFAGKKLLHCKVAGRTKNVPFVHFFTVSLPRSFPLQATFQWRSQKTCQNSCPGGLLFYFFFWGGPDTLRITNPSPGVSHSSFFLKYPSLRLIFRGYFFLFFNKKETKKGVFTTLNA
jgi:hypothetical protein